ncbi:MAG: trigger factor [Coxiellaceae bacterium]|nr:trigger factor [Coxiellaceae bacterium]
MQVSVENLEGLSRRLKVSLPADMIDNKYSENLKKAAKQADVPGFRKGKVPANVIEQKYGAQIRQDVLGEVLESSFRKAVEENEIKIAGMPQVEPLGEYKKGEEFEFAVKYETYPDIELKTLDGDNVEEMSAEVQDSDIDSMMNKLREQNAEWTLSEQPAQRGNKVNINFEGFIDGEAFEGGKAEGFDLELGSNSMIPGFEDQLLACSHGDEATITVNFPEDYHAKELAGKPAEFKVKVNKVLVQQPVENDDKLAEKLGVEGGAEKLREKAKENMVNELKRGLLQHRKEGVLNQLLAKNDIMVPASLVDEEVKHLQQMALQQMSGGQNIKDLDLSKLNLPKEPYMEEASKRVKLGLLLAEVIKMFEIKPDQDMIRARVDEIASMYPEPEKVVEWYYSNRESLSEVESAVIEDIAVDRLIEKMVVNQKQATYDEVMNPPKDDKADNKE